MVQGGLLTSHPGGGHGDGEAPRGGSSLWQGAGIGSPDNPDIVMVAAEQRKDWEKGFAPRAFGARTIYRRRGVARGATSGPGAPLAWPTPRAHQQGAWGPGDGPLAPLWLFQKVLLR